MPKQKARNYLKLFLFLLGFSLLSCGNREKAPAEVMRADGPWKARFSEIEGKVKAIHADRMALDESEADSAAMKKFSTEFPYWERMELLHSEGKLQRARLISREGRNHKTEDFYFREGKLIFATILAEKPGDDLSPFRGEQYYFYQQKLVKAIIQDEEQDLENEALKLKALDLLSEARYISSLPLSKISR